MNSVGTPVATLGSSNSLRTSPPVPCKKCFSCEPQTIPADIPSEGALQASAHVCSESATRQRQIYPGRLHSWSGACLREMICSRKGRSIC